MAFMRMILMLVPVFSSFLVFVGSSMGGDSNTNAADSSAKAGKSGSCMERRFQNFIGDKAVWGFMPGLLEREAICRIESGEADLRQAREGFGVDEKGSVTRELLKLRIMDRISRDSEGFRGTVSVFSRSLVKNPPRMYLDMKPGVKLEQAPHMDTSGVRERIPDLGQTLDTGNAPKIYLFRRTDERLAAVCIEPKEDGTCKEIIARKQYEQQNKKKVEGEEEGGVKRFMKKVKSAFTGSPPKEIIQWKTRDFYGVRIAETAYAFDYDFKYMGFFAKIAEREPFASGESPQYIRDVFRALIRQFGEPCLKLKGPDPKSGVNVSHAIWVTDDGFRIEAMCEKPANGSGLCREGRIAVRRLPPVESIQPAEDGARFFE